MCIRDRAQGVVTRLMQILGDSSLPIELRTEAAVTLGSLAKGTEAHVKQLIDVGLVPLLLNSKYFVVFTFIM